MYGIIRFLKEIVVLLEICRHDKKEKVALAQGGNLSFFIVDASTSDATTCPKLMQSFLP